MDKGKIIEFIQKAIVSKNYDFSNLMLRNALDELYSDEYTSVEKELPPLMKMVMVRCANGERFKTYREPEEKQELSFYRHDKNGFLMKNHHTSVTHWREYNFKYE